MPHLQSLRERPERDGAARPEGLGLEQEQILLGLETDRTGRLLTDPEEPADVIPRLGERPVVDRPDPRGDTPSSSHMARYIGPIRSRVLRGSASSDRWSQAAPSRRISRWGNGISIPAVRKRSTTDWYSSPCAGA